MTERVLVCGGRMFNDPHEVNRMLMTLHKAKPISVLIEGEAEGADTLARNWALLNKIPVEAYFADWNLFGNRAGSIRNSRMLRDGKPTLGVAFPGQEGTRDMIKKLIAAGVPTYVGRHTAFDSQVSWVLR